MERTILWRGTQCYPSYSKLRRLPLAVGEDRCHRPPWVPKLIPAQAYSSARSSLRWCTQQHMPATQITLTQITLITLTQIILSGQLHPQDSYTLGKAYTDYACYSDHAHIDYTLKTSTPHFLAHTRQIVRTDISARTLSSALAYAYLAPSRSEELSQRSDTQQTTLAYTGRYYQLTPKLIPLNNAAQHS
ncbi:hypothetical protein F511_35288 [Dorcoceras hygrometricum]|uniref:Uncharacterized protein n=1 Tax=Dorcoceras hygrometricum TaxID=472368 RepID=A0A2Z7BLC7_9LAMI|nr:hypothetical protein F511_35288 [Dorcoceras hygrometricum]